MDIKQAIQTNFSLQEFVISAYLADLSQAEWLTRPVPGVNHIAWQVGHLITAEWGLVGKVLPGRMDPLPAGFAASSVQGTPCTGRHRQS